MAPLRHVPRICDQTPKESTDFFAVVRELEPALERSFGAALINFSCLRNWAYRAVDPDPPFLNGQPNPHVHWHVLTRYAQPVTFEGVTFTDEAFGGLFKPRGERAQGIRDKIIARIQGELRLEYL